MRIRLILLQVIGVRVVRSDGESLRRRVPAVVSDVDSGVDDGDGKVEDVIVGEITSGPEQVRVTGLGEVDFRREELVAVHKPDGFTNVHVRVVITKPVKTSLKTLT